MGKYNIDIDKFGSIEYLMNGTEKQKRIYKILHKIRIFEILEEFTPVLTGTFPLDIDIEGSDLDLICEVINPKKYIPILKNNFSEMDGFQQNIFFRNNSEVILTNFFFEEMEFEIFGQNKPVKEQNAYRHMINEYKALQLYGKDFKQKIISLKQSGMKTEPAFASALGLSGDPYEAILNIKI